MATGNVAQIIVKAKTGAAQKSLSRLNKTMGGMSKAAKGLAIASVAGGAALGAVGAKAFSMAAGLEAVQQKTQIVFGDQLPMVQQWADTTANAMGLSSMEAQGLAANFGDLLIPMGFSRDMAAEMATETIGLSGALAEWSGGTKTAAEVSDILAKAMLGEREQLKTLGISITEADVKQRLATMGMEKATGQALQQAKAQATQQLIFEKSADAQAKYAEGSGSLMRTQAELTASLKTMKDEVLIALMPTFKSLADFMQTSVIPAIQNFIPIIQEKIPQAIEAAQEGFEAAKPFIKMFMTGLVTIKDAAMGLYNFWQNQGPVMKAAIAAVGVALAIAFGPVSLGFVAIVGLIALLGTLRENWRDITNSILGIVESLAQGVANIIHSIVTNIHLNLINKIIGLINGFLGTVNKLLAVLPGTNLQLGLLKEQHLDPIEIQIPRIAAASQKLVEVVSDIEPVVTELGEEMQNTFTDMAETVSTKAEEVSTTSGHLASLQADALLKGEMDFLEFLEKNEQNINTETAKMTDIIKQRFGSEMVDEIKIMDSVVRQLWETHKAGIDAAIKEEEKLAAQRNAKMAAQARNNIMLLTALHKSAEASGAAYTGPSHQFDLEGNLVKIPKAHSGGIVPGPRGRETPIMAQGGEAILPLGSRGGVTININGLIAGDPILIGRQIADIINKSARANRGLIKSEAVAS